MLFTMHSTMQRILKLLVGSTSREASGKIRVIFTHPISSGYCRDYQVQLQIKKRIRSKTLTACKRVGSLDWGFHYYELPEDKKFFN